MANNVTKQVLPLINTQHVMKEMLRCNRTGHNSVLKIKKHNVMKRLSKVAITVLYKQEIKKKKERRVNHKSIVHMLQKKHVYYIRTHIPDSNAAIFVACYTVKGR